MPLAYQKTGGPLCAVMSEENQQKVAPFTCEILGNPLAKSGTLCTEISGILWTEISGILWSEISNLWK
jgi:hypothetical protein